MEKSTEKTYAGRISQTGSQEVKAPAQIAPKKGKSVVRREKGRRTGKKREWRDRMEITEQSARYEPEAVIRAAEGEGAALPAAYPPEGFPGREAPAAEEDGSGLVQKQLAQIARLDPEMKDLERILRSEAGPRFRDYVEMGLDFVDAYTLAARSRLAALQSAEAAEAARVKAAGKDHLNATQSRGGEGDIPMPPDELELFRALLPGTPDSEFRKYWNKNRRK